MTNLNRPVTRPGSDLFKKNPLGGIEIPPAVPEKDKPFRTKKRVSSFGGASFLSSTFTNTRDLIPRSRRSSFDAPRQSTQPRHQRTRVQSFSSVDDRLSRKSSFSANGGSTFKVVIRRPRAGSRRQTARSNYRDDESLPQVPQIPSDLPSPKSTKFGTHLEPSDAHVSGNREVEENALLGEGADPAETRPLSDGTGRHTSATSRLANQTAFFGGQDSSDILIPRAKVLDTQPTRTSNTALAMHIFNDLSTRFDDPSVVRYAPKSQEIIAATPSRLIAHITSPSFLDYELLSDFFLTFRLFMQTDDLATFLVARLRWSVERQDDSGRIVRVRTFVALRHWILNYFADDFAPDFALRCHFSDLMNDLFHDLRQRMDGGGGDVKLIGELKKCWRRTCALYWPNAGKLAHLDDDLLPGGRYESINFDDEDINTDFLQADPDAAKSLAAKKRYSRRSGISQRGNLSPLSPINRASRVSADDEHGEVPLSPTSIQSLHVVSCSLPIRSNKSDTSSTSPMQPHPHPVSRQNVASTAQVALKSGYSTHHHNRSFDSTWEDPNFVEDAYQIGSLARGALYQPTNPYFEWSAVDRLPPSSSHGNGFGIDVLDMTGSTRSTEYEGRGMKKLFGNVRRVLGGKSSNTFSRSNSSFDEKAVEHGDLSNSKQEAGQSNVQLRIDLLTSWAAEQYKDALNEELGIGKPDKGKKRAIESMGPHDLRIPTQRSVTVGSRSILIMDGTNDFPEPPLMSGAILNRVGADLEHEQFGNEEEEVDGLSAITPLSGTATPRRSGETDISALEEEFRRAQPPRAPVAAGAYMPTGYKRAVPATRQPKRSSSIGAESVDAAAAASAARLKKYASFHSGFMNSTHTSYVKPSARASMVSGPPSPLPPGIEDNSEPARTLRRRPGGDLKGTNNAEDLGKRRHSLGSVSTPANSVPASYVQPRSRTGTNTRPPQSMHNIRTPRDTTSDDKRSQKSASASAATPRRRRRGKSISLMETHSSQPNLRPSFEAEVAKLKALPDDELDDGGIQATLLKLEGKYEPKSPEIGAMSKTRNAAKGKEDFKHKRHHEHVEDVHPEQTLPSVTTLAKGSRRRENAPLPPKPYSERKKDPKTATGPNAPTVDQLLKHAASINRQTDGASPAHGRALSQSSKVKAQPITSFLLDDQQELEDDDMISGNADDNFFNDNESAKSENLGPRSIAGALHKAQAGRSEPGSGQPTTTFNQGLPTPEGSPTLEPLNADLDKSQPDSSKRKNRLALDARKRRDTPPDVGDENDDPSEYADLPTPRDSTMGAAHLPFIMAYEVDFLAKQFTIVERDALDELDWRELIEIRWNQSPPAVRDWVTYLRSTEGTAAGVGLVIARFNLMVKWVLSELLLTSDDVERARVMVHFIRIACASRKLRNFATMYQISVALLSADAARMRKAWLLVPQPERENLRDLERIVQPLRNFHNLRLEMETAPTEAGCIPFIGIYTRDLVYNAQKPVLFSPRKHPHGKLVPARPGTDAIDVDGDDGAREPKKKQLPMMVMGEGEPMVNFERQHSAASIVKTLLRLLEQSANYKFVSDPSVVSRCLWVASLSDDEIKDRVTRVE
jgi:hypothetical protein